MNGEVFWLTWTDLIFFFLRRSDADASHVHVAASLR
jgi:hypothetical protein